MKNIVSVIIISFLFSAIYTSQSSAQDQTQNLLRANTQSISYDNFYVKNKDEGNDKYLFAGALEVITFEGIFSNSDKRKDDSTSEFTIFYVPGQIEYTITYNQNYVTKDEKIEVIEGQITKKFLHATQIPWPYEGKFIINRENGIVIMKENFK